MPLFAGFTTKFLLFQAITQEGFLWLAALGVINSLVSLYYYLVIMRQMYVGEPEEPSRLRIPLVTNAVTFSLVIGIFFIGLFPQPLFNAVDSAAAALFQITP
jgi:NADH-quinone oxidoreductase subunit N